MTYLTSNEIADIKAIKNQYINEAELTELSNYLKKHNREISTVKKNNIKNTWDVILESFDNSVVKHPSWLNYKKAHSGNEFFGEKEWALETCLSQIDPKLFKINEIANRLEFDNAIRQIKQKTESVKSFQVEKYVLSVNFDFKPFSIESVDKNLIENTTAIDKAVSKFFESLTAGLNAEQKTIISKNLFNTVNFFVTNSTPTTVKEKGNDFKNLIEYVKSQSI